ncbi:MAG: RNA polymerase sigma-70 factor [Bacteroidales bacterium]|nr:RNA polymerase sigma-70 factor [Bacteroidales bacterium]
MDASELNSLIERMKSGDRESFNKIFRRFYAPLVRFCFRFVADEDVASEIVQDLFVRLWTGRHKLKISSSFESYLVSSVRNAAYTYINTQRSHNEAHLMMYTNESDEADPAEKLQSNNLEESYRKVLAAMPEKRREVFMASRFDGMKYSEIAEKLHISQKTVEAHMMAAIKQLREGLKEYL